MDIYPGLSGLLPWTQWTFNMDSLDFYHGLSGHLPWTLWTFTMDSVDIYHGLSGHLPWTQWTFTMDSVDIYHGLSGQSGQYTPSSLLGGWVGQWCWVASSAGRPTTLAYGRAGACCACSRCGMGGLCFIFFKSHLSYLPFLMPHLLRDGWTFWNIVVSAVITQQ